MNKDVIYVDVDDEITTVIDKVNASQAKVVALVLPKRAGVFQSVVNMKLLKRRAEAAKKHIVLVTSEAGLMPLAGLAGLYVAATPQSKPEIPVSGLDASALDDDDEEAADLDDFDKQGNAGAPVGALAGASAGNGQLRPASVTEDDTIELDNTTPDKKKATPAASKPARQVSAAAAADRALSGAKDSKPKIPNFLRFRKRLIIGGLVLVLLIAGWIVANNVLPKATVTITTDSSDLNSRFDMTLDTAAGQVDAEDRIIPAQSKQEQKSNTQSVPATGQENKGEKAEGSIQMTATMCAPNIGQPDDVAAGTGVTANGNTYLTQSAATFTFAGGSGSCVNYRSTSDISIVAIKGGQSYNTASDASFTVTGNITGKGSATGGTDNNVKVVQQSDIDSAKQKLTAGQDQEAIKRQLQSRLEDDNLFALSTTFFAGAPTVNTSSNVGDEANDITVTQSTTYTMFGVKQADLKALVAGSLKGKYDDKKQSIQEDGLADAQFSVPSPGAGPQLTVGAALTATVGPKLDTDNLRQQIVGMKSGQVKTTIQATPGVTGVEVKYSPFWVTKAPKAEKITIQYDKAAKDNSDE